MIKPVAQDEAFLDAVLDAARDEPDSLHVWWLGQSGFLVSANDQYLLLDPYLSDSLTNKYAATNKPHVRMTERVVSPDLLAKELYFQLVTSSHNHTDHLDAETLLPLFRADHALPLVFPEANWQFVMQRLNGEVQTLIGMDDGQTERVLDAEVTGVAAAHDVVERDERGRCKYLGYVLRFFGRTLYHSGDTVIYDGMVEKLRPFGIDVAILPINGKVGNMGGRDAARLAKQIRAKLVIPCHYEMFEFNTADPRDQFIPECERLGQPYKVLRAGERWSSGG